MLSFILGVSDDGALSQWGIALAGGFLGSIVGAYIGGRYAVGAVRTADTLSRLHETEKLADELRARRVALNAELEYILESAVEIIQVLKMPAVCTKHLNWDFLEACRLDWYKADSDEAFIKALAQAYRDVVHTNERLSEFMEWARVRAEQGRADPTAFRGVAEHTLKSLDGVKGSVSELMKLTVDKLASTASPLTAPSTK